MNDYKWMKIDTPSIMFSCLSTKKWGRTFRVGVHFKNVQVDEHLLCKAVADLQPRFPHIFSKLKKGFFWNYLEQTEGLPEIRAEQARAGEPIVLRKDARPDFRIVYDEKMLAVETAHYITDGFGCLQFLLSLAQHYLELAGCMEVAPTDGVLFWQDAPSAEEFEDSFARYGDADCEKAKDEKHDAYRLPAVYEKDYLRLTYFTMPVDQVLVQARSLQLTLTEYMTAVLMLAVIRSAKEPIGNSIGVDIPVNLRAFFESKTLRNFVYQVSTLLPVDNRQDWTLEEIADVIRGQSRALLNPADLQSILKKMGSLAKNPVVRVVPNFIKTPVLRVLQARSHADETSIITNLGNVSVTDAMAQHIDHFEFVNGDTSGYKLPSTCSAVSFKNTFVFCVSASNSDASFCNELAGVLHEEGISLQIAEKIKPQNLLIPFSDGKGKAEGSLFSKAKAYFSF